MSHNRAMASPQHSSVQSRVWKVLGYTALIISGAALTTYMVTKIRRDHKAQQLLVDLPAKLTTAPPQDEQQHADLAESATQTVENPEAPTQEKAQHRLETMTVDQLYELAKEYDIPGRSTMRKAQLIEALQTVDMTETTE